MKSPISFLSEIGLPLFRRLPTIPLLSVALLMGSSPAYSADILIITGNPSQETAYESFLESPEGGSHVVDVSTGYTGLLGPTELAALNSYDLIIFRTSSANYYGGAVTDQWNALQTPVLVHVAGLVARNGGRWDWINRDSGATASGTGVIGVVDPTHPVFDGVDTSSGTAALYDPSASIGYLGGNNNTGNARIIAEAVPASQRAGLAEWKAGQYFRGSTGPQAGGDRFYLPLPAAVPGNMTTAGRKLLANLVAYATDSAVAPGLPGVYIPADANVINVKTAYGAIGDGVADDTAAIQAAVTANLSAHRTLYFPPGTYKISNTIDFRRPDGKYGALITIQGAGRDHTFIRLADGVFPSASSPKPMMKMGSIDSTTGGGNRAHGNNVFDLTLHSGNNNPGAVGLDYNGSNVGAVFRVDIISGDGQGDTGLKLTVGVGPASFKDILIDGFNRGIHTQQLFFGMSFEHITLQNQNVVGFLNDGNTVAVRGLISHNSVTAFHSQAWHATAVLIDSELNRTGGSQPAIRHDSGSLTVRNVVNNGYATAIQTPSGQANITGAHVAEYVGVSDANNGPLSLHNDPVVATLNLQIKETPEYFSDNPADWVSVIQFGAVPGDGQDDTAAVAAAMQAGKPVVYFPRGTYNFTGAEIEVPEGVRLIAGFGSFLNGVKFRFTNHTEAVVLDRLQAHNSNRGTLKLNGTGAVVFKHGSEMEIDLSSGPRLLFLEDVVARPLAIGADDVVFARGLNIEHPGPMPMILNDGGYLWALLYKTEHGNTVLHARNGAESEIMAGFFYPAQGVPSAALSPLTREEVAMIRNENSWLSLSYTHRGSSTAANNYHLHAEDLRGNDLAQLVRGTGHRFRALLSSRPPEAPPAAPGHILLVGDTTESLQAMATYLQSPSGGGHTVEVTTGYRNGLSAADQAQLNSYDLVIMNSASNAYHYAQDWNGLQVPVLLVRAGLAARNGGRWNWINRDSGATATRTAPLVALDPSHAAWVGIDPGAGGVPLNDPWQSIVYLPAGMGNGAVLAETGGASSPLAALTVFAPGVPFRTGVEAPAGWRVYFPLPAGDPTQNMTQAGWELLANIAAWLTHL